MNKTDTKTFEEMIDERGDSNINITVGGYASLVGTSARFDVKFNHETRQIEINEIMLESDELLKYSEMCGVAKYTIKCKPKVFTIISKNFTWKVEDEI